MDLRIAVILGTVRKGRFSEKSAQWILEQAKKHGGASYELLDLRDYPMPFLSDETPPSQVTDGNYPNEMVRSWAQKIRNSDGFIIVSPEYNHGTSGVLKNAIDHIYAEWNNKPVAFVSHGSAAGGARAVEHLRLISVELQMAPIRAGVHIANYWDQLDEKGNWKSEPYNRAAEGMLTQLLWWTRALKAARDQHS